MFYRSLHTCILWALIRTISECWSAWEFVYLKAGVATTHLNNEYRYYRCSPRMLKRGQMRQEEQFNTPETFRNCDEAMGRAFLLVPCPLHFVQLRLIILPGGNKLTFGLRWIMYKLSVSRKCECGQFNESKTARWPRSHADWITQVVSSCRQGQ